MSAAGLQLTVSARAENIAVVRHAVAGLGEAIGMDDTLLADLKTVVSEACMNAVVHAYPDDPGPIEIRAIPDRGGLTVSVRDFGAGVRPGQNADHPSLRLGLPLIAALSERFELKGTAGGGTEVLMRVPISLNGGSETAASTAQRETRGAELSVTDPALVAPIVSRVLSILAARSELSVDRVSDVLLISDAISDQLAGAFSDGAVRMSVEDGIGTLDVRVGPMRSGEGERLRRELFLPQINASLEQLADSVEIDPATDGEGEYLVLRIAAAEPGPAA